MTDHARVIVFQYDDEAADVRFVPAEAVAISVTTPTPITD